MEHQEEKIKGYNRRRQSPLPIDLTSEILLRLPVKSVARFRCVSKLWLSITTDPYFINLFETRSPRPSLLLIFRKDDNLFVSSIPQHTHSLHDQDSNKAYNSSSQLIDSYHMKLPGGEYDSELHPTESVHGLICFRDSEKPIVWNPSKKQFLTLPKPRVSWKSLKVFLGYDPVEGKHKVMCMPLRASSDVCLILTLGNISAQDKSWRTVETNYTHFCAYRSNGRCIDGVIYYAAYIRQTDDYVLVVMSFDVRSEKFDMIPLPSKRYWGSLITYEARLAYVGTCERRMWILEDAKRHKWSSQDNFLSFFAHYDEHLQTYCILRGFTHAGEFVFAPSVFSRSLYVLFYDPVTSRFRRFEFEGIAEGEQFAAGLRIPLYAFPNHTESPNSL